MDYGFLNRLDLKYWTLRRLRGKDKVLGDQVMPVEKTTL